MVKRLLLLSAALATFYACRSDLFLGQIEGVGALALAPNGQTPLYDGLVVLENVKNPSVRDETRTAACGDFAFPDAPDGQYRLTLTSRNGLFHTIHYAEVVAGHYPGGVELTMTPARAGTFYDVPGRYDSAGKLLADLGYLYHTMDVGALAVAPNPLAAADVVCLNSGADIAWADNAAVVANLRSFVDNGGRLVVSDRAWPFVKAAWPDAVSWGENPEIGEGAQAVAVEFTDADFRKYVNVTEWRVHYDLDRWTVPASTVGTVYVRGDVATTEGAREGAPLLIGFASGEGCVAYSTFSWRTEYAAGRTVVRAFYYFLANK